MLTCCARSTACMCPHRGVSSCKAMQRSSFQIFHLHTKAHNKTCYGRTLCKGTYIRLDRQFCLKIYRSPTSLHTLLISFLCDGSSLKCAAQTWHNRQLSGLFVLQVDEVVNIAAAAKQRYELCVHMCLTAGPATFQVAYTAVSAEVFLYCCPCRQEEAADKRCLKLMLTDGMHSALEQHNNHGCWIWKAQQTFCRCASAKRS